MTREKIEALIAHKRFEIKLCDINSKYLKPEDLRNQYYNSTKKLLLKSEISLLELLMSNINMDKDKAIEIIRELHANSDSSVTTALETLFPEIFETENEKIKKEITQYFECQSKEEPFRKEIHDKWISWIQKQGEQKHKFNIGNIISNGKVVYRVDNIVKNCIGQDCYFLVNVEAEKNGTRDLMIDSQGEPFRYGEITWLCEQVDKSFEKKEFKVEPKFKVGDWIIGYRGIFKITQYEEKYGYELTSIEGYVVYSISSDYVDSNYRLWTLNDAKDGDVLVHSSFMFDNFIFIYDKTSLLQAYCYYSKERDRFIIEDRGHYCPWNMQEVKPATKEQRDTLFTKMKESGYEWDSEQKQLKEIEQKSAWSAEDTFKVQRICKYLDEVKKYSADITEVRECKDWLKSLETKNNSN